MSSNVPNAMAGSKPQPLQNLNSSVQTTAPAPLDRLSAWNASLNSVALTDASAAQNLLEQVAHGIASPNDAPLAQAVFNDLIQHEAYDVFVEVFTAYNAIRASHVRAPNEPPFKTSLTLQLPADWAPTGPAAFEAALQKVHVQRLEVVHPEVDESRFQPLQKTNGPIRSFFPGGPGNVFDPHEHARIHQNRAIVAEKYDAPVPEAACDAIVTLLQTGTTELVVRGNLTRPNMIARALPASALQSIELGHRNHYARDMSSATIDSYGTLMQGVTKCGTLQHLILRQAELLTLHASVDGLGLGCPALKSVQVRNDSSRGPDSCLAPFLETVAQCENVEKVTIKNLTTFDLTKEVFGPLSKLSTLTTLDLELPFSAQIHDVGDWGVMAEVMRFSKSCPSMKHLNLIAPAIETHTDFWSRTSHLSAIQSADRAMTDEFLQDPTINLETLTVSGLPITHLFLSAIFAKIPKTLKAFDFSGCIVSANATLGLPETLIHNETLHTGTLPKDPRAYFMVGTDQHMHGLGDDFQLLFTGNTGAVSQNIALASYERIKTKLKDAPTATQAMLDHRAAALEALTKQVSGVMQMAAPLSLSSFSFQDIASRVLPYIVGDAQDLRDAVRLSEVGIAADPFGLHSGKHTPDSLKAAVSAANGTPVARTTTNTTATTTTTGDPSVTATSTPDGSGAPKQG